MVAASVCMAPALKAPAPKSRSGNRLPLLHQRLDLRDLARRSADALHSLVGDDVVILDAHAGVLVLQNIRAHLRNERAVARRIRQHLERIRRDVDTGFDHERVAYLEFAVTERPLPRVVYSEAEAVGDAVDHPEVRLAAGGTATAVRLPGWIEQRISA